MRQSLWIPRDTHNITVFNNHQIAICSKNDIQIADPAKCVAVSRCLISC